MASHHSREELLAASALGVLVAVGGFGADYDRQGEEGGEKSEGDHRLLSVPRRGQVMRDGETLPLLYAKNMPMHESGTAQSSNF